MTHMSEPWTEIDEIDWDALKDGLPPPPPGVIRINGQPIPMIEFDLTPSDQIWTSEA